MTRPFLISLWHAYDFWECTRIHKSWKVSAELSPTFWIMFQRWITYLETRYFLDAKNFPKRLLPEMYSSRFDTATTDMILNKVTDSGISGQSSFCLKSKEYVTSITDHLGSYILHLFHNFEFSVTTDALLPPPHGPKWLWIMQQRKLILSAPVSNPIRQFLLKTLWRINDIADTNHCNCTILKVIFPQVFYDSHEYHWILFFQVCNCPGCLHKSSLINPS